MILAVVESRSAAHALDRQNSLRLGIICFLNKVAKADAYNSCSRKLPFTPQSDRAASATQSDHRSEWQRQVERVSRTAALGRHGTGRCDSVFGSRRRIAINSLGRTREFRARG